jgi:hypothetical protein
VPEPVPDGSDIRRISEPAGKIAIPTWGRSTKHRLTYGARVAVAKGTDERAREGLTDRARLSAPACTNIGAGPRDVSEWAECWVPAQRHFFTFFFYIF